LGFDFGCGFALAFLAALGFSDRLSNEEADDEQDDGGDASPDDFRAKSEHSVSFSK
jgi:hypothetical protein